MLQDRKYRAGRYTRKLWLGGQLVLFFVYGVYVIRCIEWKYSFSLFFSLVITGAHVTTTVNIHFVDDGNECSKRTDERREDEMTEIKISTFDSTP